MFPDIGDVHGRLLPCRKEILLYVGENVAENVAEGGLQSDWREEDGL